MFLAHRDAFYHVSVYLTWTLRDSKFRFQEGEWNYVPLFERITSGFMTGRKQWFIGLFTHAIVVAAFSG